MKKISVIIIHSNKRAEVIECLNISDAEEISILSNGLICLIDNAYKAEKLTCETSIIKALDESVKIYQKLNQKICNSVSKME